MKKTNKQATYEVPLVECLEVTVEKGFQTSLDSTGNESYDVESGNWDSGN